MRASCSANGVRKLVRKSLKWGGAAITALLVLAWAASTSWSFTWHNMYEERLILTDGRIELLHRGTGRAWTIEHGRIVRRAADMLRSATTPNDMLRVMAEASNSDPRELADELGATPPPSKAQLQTHIDAELEKLRFRLTFASQPMRLKLWFDWSIQSYDWRYAVPLWIPSIATLAITSLAWRYDLRADRRSRKCCITCGYDRRGIPSNAPCPECGNANVA